MSEHQPIQPGSKEEERSESIQVQPRLRNRKDGSHRRRHSSLKGLQSGNGSSMQRPMLRDNPGRNRSEDPRPFRPLDSQAVSDRVDRTRKPNPTRGGKLSKYSEPGSRQPQIAALPGGTMLQHLRRSSATKPQVLPIQRQCCSRAQGRRPEMLVRRAASYPGLPVRPSSPSRKTSSLRLSAVRSYPLNEEMRPLHSASILPNWVHSECDLQVAQEESQRQSRSSALTSSSR